MKNNQILLETKLVSDIKGTLYVPSYQRGYRWGADEVLRLLNDVYSNGKKNYCLQPVVVRKSGDSYELIDGQQRLTTLYLIYRYMKNVNPFFSEPAFNLEYQTRNYSSEFLHFVDMSRREENPKLLMINGLGPLFIPLYQFTNHCSTNDACGTGHLYPRHFLSQ